MASDKKKPMTEKERDAKIARCQKTIAEIDRDLNSFARSVKWSESVQAFETRKAEHCDPLLMQRKRLTLEVRRLEHEEVETKTPRAENP